MIGADSNTNISGIFKCFTIGHEDMQMISYFPDCTHTLWMPGVAIVLNQS